MSFIAGHERQGDEGERPSRSGPGTSTVAAGRTCPASPRSINPQVRGWINYYGAFYRSELYFLARRIDEHLVRWAMRKFKRFRAERPSMGVARCRPAARATLFAHWHLLPATGRPVGAV